MNLLRRGLIVALAAVLGGCIGGDTGGFSFLQGLGQGRGVRTISLFDGDVRVRAPEGYCIDQEASQADTGFTVMAGCALVSSAAIMPEIDGLLTVQVAATDSAMVAGAEAELLELLESDGGRTLLSSGGDAEQVTVDQVQALAGVIEVYFHDTDPNMHEGLGFDQWRAFFDMNGRLVTVGVRGYRRAPLSKAAGSRLLRLTVAALRDANPSTGDNLAESS